MRILAIDTATERCSVALLIEGRFVERSVETARGHAELVLPMVDAVLREGGVQLTALDALAYGRGPGAFTGVRIAVGVAQGLGFGAGLVTIGISDLAAVAQQVARPGEDILVCMDARMGEVYWGRFHCAAGTALVESRGPERVDPPQNVTLGSAAVLAGTGFNAYPQLRTEGAAIHADVLPRAREIALLGAAARRAGQGQPASEAEPVYLRDQVVTVKGP